MLSVLIALLLSLFGINTPVPNPPGPQGSEIVLQVGETERIPIGTTNQSARRVPGVVTKPDAGVAAHEVTRENPPADCKPGGCEEPTFVSITGIAPGKTSFEVQECFVSDRDKCDPLGPVRQYVVVVEG